MCEVTQLVVLEKLVRIICNVRSEITMSRMLSCQVDEAVHPMMCAARCR